MSRPWRRLPRWCGWLAVLGVQLLVLGLEAGEPPRRALGDEVFYQRAALQLLESGTTDLNPLWPPLYAFFLAAVRWLGGGSWWLLPWIQGGLLLLSARLLQRLARRLLGGRQQCDLAPLLLLCYPPMVAFSHYFWPEILHLVLMLGAVDLLLQNGRRIGRMLAYGMVLGAAVATKALLTPWLPLLLLAVAWRPIEAAEEAPDPGRWARRWRPVLWASLGLAIVSLPIMSWNAQRVGVFALSDSAAFNLWVGLEDTSGRSFVDPVVGREYQTFLASGEEHSQRQSILWRQIREKVEAEGVVSILGAQLRRQYHRLFHRDTYFSDQLPGGLLTERGRGYPRAAPWLATSTRWLSYAVYGAILCLACLGMTVAVPSRRPWLWAVAAFIAYNLTLFLFLHVKSRYRIQMMPWLLLYAQCGWLWWRCRMSGQQPPEVLVRWPGESSAIAGLRWGVCAVAVAVLLYLAFLS